MYWLICCYLYLLVCISCTVTLCLTTTEGNITLKYVRYFEFSIRLILRIRCSVSDSCFDFRSGSLMVSALRCFLEGGNLTFSQSRLPSSV